MTQTTVLAAAQTAAASSNIVVVAGQQITVGLFASSEVPSPVRCSIFQKGPSGAQFIAALTGINVSTVLTGPGTFYVTRPVISTYGVNVGVYTES